MSRDSRVFLGALVFAKLVGCSASDGHESTVSVYDGGWLFDGQRLASSYDLVEAIKVKSPDSVLVSTCGKVAFEHLKTTIEVVKSAGVIKVGLSTSNQSESCEANL